MKAIKTASIDCTSFKWIAWKLMHECQHPHSFVNKISPLLRLFQSYTAEMPSVFRNNALSWNIALKAMDGFVQRRSLQLTGWLSYYVSQMETRFRIFEWIPGFRRVAAFLGHWNLVLGIHDFSIVGLSPLSRISFLRMSQYRPCLLLDSIALFIFSSYLTL
jgi:hypothetical protein